MDNEIKNKFTITCNKCGSIDIDFEFEAGFISDGSGSTGNIKIICKQCGNEYFDY